MSKAQAIARALAESGVKAAFGVTGGGLTLRTIAEFEAFGVDFQPTAHEAAAAIMAGAHARRAGAVGCAIGIRGPGLASMLPGIGLAALEQMPIVTLCEGYEPDNRSGRSHKRIDQEMATRAFTKAWGVLGDPVRILPALVAEARREAPGPVHADMTEGDSEDFRTRPVHPGGSNGGSAVEKILERISRSRRPLVVVGSLAARRTWGPRLSEMRVPLLTTLAAKGVVDERSRWAAGVLTGDGTEITAERTLALEADLVVGIGLRETEVLTPRAFPRDLVLVDVVDSGRSFGPLLRATVGEDDVIARVLNGLARATWGGDLVAQTWLAARAAVPGSWSPAVLLEVLAACTPLSCLVVDAGNFCTVAEHVWRASASDAFMASANGRWMGTAIPMAIGAGLAKPGPVATLVGDGGIRPYIAELRVAVERRLPLLVIIVSDGRYGSIAGAPKARELRGRIPSLERALAVASPPWWRVAEAFGCEARPVHGAAELEDALRDWDAQGPRVLEAFFEPDPYAVVAAGLRS